MPDTFPSSDVTLGDNVVAFPARPKTVAATPVDPFDDWMSWAECELAILGFVATVYPVTINGKTWNRVRLGPYSSAGELESVKTALADNGFNAIALKEESAN